MCDEKAILNAVQNELFTPHPAIQARRRPPKESFASRSTQSGALQRDNQDGNPATL
jgi:hypothetical protein